MKYILIQFELWCKFFHVHCFFQSPRERRKTNNIEYEEREVYDVLVYTLKPKIRSQHKYSQILCYYTTTSSFHQHSDIFFKTQHRNKRSNVSQQTSAHEHTWMFTKRQQRFLRIYALFFRGFLLHWTQYLMCATTKSFSWHHNRTHTTKVWNVDYVLEGRRVQEKSAMFLELGGALKPIIRSFICWMFE